MIMKAKKLRGRLICFFVLAAMLLTMLPTMTFVEGGKAIHLGYPSNGQYGVSGTYQIGGGTAVELAESWADIVFNDENVVFNLTPPDVFYSFLNI